MAPLSRREALKQSLKATSYVAPAVLAARAAPVAAQVSGPRCAATLTFQPPSSSSFAFRDVRWIGTGYTPNGAVQITQPSGWVGVCRGIVIVPGTTINADSAGNFNIVMPATALFQSVVRATTVQASATDSRTGCSSGIINYPLVNPGPGAVDSLTLRTIPSPATSPLTPSGSATGSGTVILGQQVGAPIAELRLTLTGGLANATLTPYITPSGGSAGVAMNLVTNARAAVTTDASGNATFAAYIGYMSNGCPGGSLLTGATLSLTTDGNPPGGSNVAYVSNLVPNNL